MSGNHLSLSVFRLKPREEWADQEGGLTFVFLRSGAAKCVAGSFNCGLVTGDVLVTNGGGFKLSASGEKEMVFGRFTARAEHMFPLFNLKEIGVLPNVLAMFKTPKLYPASAELAGECHRLVGEIPVAAQEQADLAHRSRVLRVAAAVLTAEFKNVRKQRTDGSMRLDERIVQVFEGLAVDEILGLSVDDLAAMFHCSRRHLNRLFHEYFGFSIIGLKMEVRLLKALSLLRNPDWKIIQVAEDSGFNHLGLFNTCFKKRFGASPGEWRKLNLAPAASERRSPATRPQNGSGPRKDARRGGGSPPGRSQAPKLCLMVSFKQADPAEGACESLMGAGRERVEERVRPRGAA